MSFHSRGWLRPEILNDDSWEMAVAIVQIA